MGKVQVTSWARYVLAFLLGSAVGSFVFARTSAEPHSSGCALDNEENCAVCMHDTCPPWAAWRVGPSLRKPGRILEAGHPEQAEQLLSSLLTKLTANHFDWSTIPFEEQRLPDQDLAEAPGLRRDNVSCLAQGTGPLYGQEIAFFTNLYTERDFQYLGGDNGRETTRGFYIVAWKDGTMNRVDVSDVRWYPVKLPDGSDARMPVFPGMSVYSQATKR